MKSYELAYRMQSAVPGGVLEFNAEDPRTQSLYGLDEDATFEHLAGTAPGARRLVGRGVRFVQIFHGSNGAPGAWDAHGGLKSGHSKLCGQVDKPIAGLLKDLKQRGLLDETIVVWATEFGRTPGAQNSWTAATIPYGFSGSSVGEESRGRRSRATDELGFHAASKTATTSPIFTRPCCTNSGSTSLDSRCSRQETSRIDLGKPIHEIIA
ncbi:MAG: DUF1501 domain-containing protein [Planctomycetota bacterium]